MSALYNSGYNGKFNRHGDLIRDRAPAKQEWTIGAIVNVGFLKGLLVKEHRANGDYILESQKGKMYAFQPHFGIYAL